MSAIGPIQRTWRVKLYRTDSSTPIVYEDVKHVYWSAGNTVLVIAQYTGGPQQEAHHYIHWLREHLVWYRQERASAEQEHEATEVLVEPDGEPQPVRLGIPCDCGARTMDACIKAPAHVLWAAENQALHEFVSDGCEGARQVLHTRTSG